MPRVRGGVLVGLPSLPATGGWQEAQLHSPSVSSHTHTQTHTDTSDEQAPPAPRIFQPFTPASILTSHTALMWV